MTSIPMTGVEDGGNSGVRFFPTDGELISHYLAHKISGNENQVSAITEVDNICNYEPWDLPVLAAIPSEDTWYFFSRGKRRVTRAGYWKVTGKDREIKNANNQVIGFKRLLIFYRGRVLNPERTNWVMHELSPTPSDSNGEAYVIYRLRRKQTTVNSVVDEGAPTYDPASEDPLSGALCHLPLACVGKLI